MIVNRRYRHRYPEHEFAVAAQATAAATAPTITVIGKQIHAFYGDFSDLN